MMSARKNGGFFWSGELETCCPPLFTSVVQTCRLAEPLLCDVWLFSPVLRSFHLTRVWIILNDPSDFRFAINFCYTMFLMTEKWTSLAQFDKYFSCFNCWCLKRPRNVLETVRGKSKHSLETVVSQVTEQPLRTFLRVILGKWQEYIY